MKQFFARKAVGISPSEIFNCKVSDLQSVEIYAIGSMEIGEMGVSVGNGIPLAPGESRAISHIDFRKDNNGVQNDMITIYAVASVATTVQVSGWRS